MAFWWVNQNQTFNHETGGGYLWSPKRNSNNAKNQFYDNMTVVQPDDIVFSFSGTYIKAIGVATGRAQTATKPIVFGDKGQNWSNEGWYVPVEFDLAEHPFRPVEHMDKIRPLLPEMYSPLQQNGNGKQGVYLAAIPDSLGLLILDLLQNPEIKKPTPSLAELTFNAEEQEIILDASLPETEKATLVLARRGQGVFRTRVHLIEQECRVTHVASEKLLIASHIKPWKLSEGAERLDGNNGLFLAPHVDKLFNDGYITFTQKGKMEVSPQLPSDVLPKWSIDPTVNYGKFNDDQSYFLEHHNEVTFKAAS